MNVDAKFFFVTALSFQMSSCSMYIDEQLAYRKGNSLRGFLFEKGTLECFEMNRFEACSAYTGVYRNVTVVLIIIIPTYYVYT